jgi:hypothetical protein
VLRPSRPSNETADFPKEAGRFNCNVVAVKTA